MRQDGCHLRLDLTGDKNSGQYEGQYGRDLMRPAKTRQDWARLDKTKRDWTGQVRSTTPTSALPRATRQKVGK